MEKINIILKHIFAMVVDAMVITLLGSILSLNQIHFSVRQSLALWVVSWIIYFTFLPILLKGRTLGKILFKMRIVINTKSNWKTNLKFYFTRSVLTLLCSVFLFFPLLFVLFDKQNKTMHDRILNSNIIYE
jgi:uncharacterized RDD family membrane protein YckC